MGDLSDRDRSILDTEALFFRTAGGKEQTVRDRVGLSMTRYVQVLNMLLDDAAAYEYAPVTIKRLRRLRDQRRALH